ANHASYVRSFIDSIGQDEVESFIDCCLSIDNLIDIHEPFRVKRQEEEEDDTIRERPVPKLKSKKYMDSYINPKEYLDEQREKMREQRVKKFPANPERDVLKFLLDHAPMASWEKRILEIVRDEAYYF